MTDRPFSRGWDCGCPRDGKHTACPQHATSDVYYIPGGVPARPEVPGSEEVEATPLQLNGRPWCVVKGRTYWHPYHLDDWERNEFKVRSERDALDLAHLHKFGGTKLPPPIVGWYDTVPTAAQHRASLASGDAIEAAAKALYEAKLPGLSNVSLVPWEKNEERHRNDYRILARAAAPIFRAEAETRVGEATENARWWQAHSKRMLDAAEQERDRLRAVLNRFLTEGSGLPSHRHLANYVSFPDDLWTEARALVTPPPGGATR